MAFQSFDREETRWLNCRHSDLIQNVSISIKAPWHHCGNSCSFELSRWKWDTDGGLPITPFLIIIAIAFILPFTYNTSTAGMKSKLKNYFQIGKTLFLMNLDFQRVIMIMWKMQHKYIIIIFIVFHIVNLIIIIL